MKKFFFIIAVLASLFVGCSESGEEGGGSAVNGSLVGKWLYEGLWYKLNGKWICSEDRSSWADGIFSEDDDWTDQILVFTESYYQIIVEGEEDYLNDAKIKYSYNPKTQKISSAVLEDVATIKMFKDRLEMHYMDELDYDDEGYDEDYDDKLYEFKDVYRRLE